MKHLTNIYLILISGVSWSQDNLPIPDGEGVVLLSLGVNPHSVLLRLRLPIVAVPMVVTKEAHGLFSLILSTSSTLEQLALVAKEGSLYIERREKRGIKFINLTYLIGYFFFKKTIN